MNCPRCNSKLYCPCNNCVKSRSSNKQTWEWIDGDFIKCTHCGFTTHADTWMGFDYEQQDEEDAGTCTKCGAPMQLVRPGKVQPNCACWDNEA